MISSLAKDPRGSAVVEFALVAPTFLMLLFLIFDGGRMIFAKQALNELTVATARCSAIKAPGCENDSKTKEWAQSRGQARGGLQLALSDIVLDSASGCNGATKMTKATISMSWKKTGMLLLPQSLVSSTFSSSACFPQMSASAS